MDKASVARFITLIVTLLAYFGINIADGIVEAITDIVVAIFVLYMAWKNNNITKEAVKAQQYLDELKSRK